MKALVVIVHILLKQVVFWHMILIICYINSAMCIYFVFVWVTEPRVYELMYCYSINFELKQKGLEVDWNTLATRLVWYLVMFPMDNNFLYF